MTKQLYKNPKRNVLATAVTLLMVVLICLSLTATGDGFISLIGIDQDADRWEVILTYVFAFTASACISLVGLVSWQAYRSRPNPIFIAVGITMILASSVMGLTFYNSSLGLFEEKVDKDTSDAVLQTMRTVRPLLQALEFSAEQFKALEMYSKEQATLEGSPEEDGKVRCWSRCNYRKENLQQAEMMHKVIRGKITDLGTTLRALQVSATREDKIAKVESLNEQLHYLMDNPTVDLIKQQLNAMIISWEKGIIHNYNASESKLVVGKKLYKRDSLFTTTAQTALNSLNGIKPQPIEINISTTKAAEVDNTITLLLNVMTMQFDKIKMTDWFALGLSLLVDLGIAYLSFVRSELNWTASRIQQARRESDFSLEDIRRVLMFSSIDSGKDLVLLLDNHAIRQRDHVLIKCDCLTSALNLVCIKLENMRILNRVHKCITDTVIDKLLNRNSQSKIFKIPKNAFIDLKLAATQYHCESMQTMDT